MTKHETEHLVLREIERTDFCDIHEYASDFQTTYYLGWGPNDEATTRSFMDAWFESYSKNPRRDYDFAVCLKNGAFIGVVWANIDERMKTGSIGWIIKRAHQNNGYAAEAAAALINFCFNQLDLHRVYAKCVTENIASYKVMEKLGMRKEAHHIASAVIHNEWRDEFLYALLAKEWNR